VETLKRSSKQNSAREQNFIDMDTCGWSIRKENMDYVGGFAYFYLYCKGLSQLIMHFMGGGSLKIHCSSCAKVLACLRPSMTNPINGPPQMGHVF
jgi:hypothetical protein